MFIKGKYYRHNKSGLCLKIIGRLETDCSGKMCIGERLNSQVLFAVKGNEYQQWDNISYSEWESCDISIKDHVIMEAYLDGADHVINKSMRQEFDIT